MGQVIARLLRYPQEAPAAQYAVRAIRKENVGGSSNDSNGNGDIYGVSGRCFRG